MSNPFTEAISIAEALWAARWTNTEIPVLWHQNTRDATPSRINTDYWVHVAVEIDEEQAIAFGGGPGQIERELRGCVVIRVFGARGAGETTILQLLDDAVNVYRSQRSDGFSVIGSMPLQQPGASDDGSWWIRTAIAAFVYRFRG